MRKQKAALPVVPRMQTAPRTPPPLEGVRLPYFSADNTYCIKCGHKGADTSYKSAGECCTHTGYGQRVVWGMERLHRTCTRCKFTWDEGCVPAIPQTVKDTMVMPVVRG